MIRKYSQEELDAAVEAAQAETRAVVDANTIAVHNAIDADRTAIAKWLRYLSQDTLADEVLRGTHLQPDVVVRVERRAELVRLRARVAELEAEDKPDQPTGELPMPEGR